MKKIFLLIIVHIYIQNIYSQCTSTLVTELVQNGDFELGYLTNNGSTYGNGENRLFGSGADYAGDWSGDLNDCKCLINDEWVVARREATTCVENDIPNIPFAGCYLQTIPFTDHTPGMNGEGFAFVIDFNENNASNFTTYPGGLPVLWFQNVKTVPGETYTFSSWFANFNFDDPGDPELYFVVVPKDNNGNLIQAERSIVGTSTPSGNMEWSQYSGTWTNTTYTEVQISIEVDFLLNDPANGVDFALDDISFINGCKNIDGIESPFFDSDTINICATADGFIDIEAMYDDPDNDLSNNEIYWYHGTSDFQVPLTEKGLTLDNANQTGTYRICIESDNGCATNASVVVSSNMTINLSDMEICVPEQVNLDVSQFIEPEGSFDKDYFWSVPASYDNPGNSPLITLNDAGIISVTVSNANYPACSTEDQFEVTLSSSSNCCVSPKGEVVIQNRQDSLSSCDPFILSALSSVVMNYHYQWFELTNQNTLVALTEVGNNGTVYENGQIFSPIINATGNYVILIAKKGQGFSNCVIGDTINVQIHPETVTTINGSGFICQGESQLVKISLSPANISYEAYYSGNNTQASSITGIDTIAFDIDYEDEILLDSVIDENGCTATIQGTRSVLIQTEDLQSAAFASEYVIRNNTNIAIWPGGEVGNNCYWYYNEEVIHSPVCDTFTISPDSTMTIFLYTSNDRGCEDSVSITITVMSEIRIPDIVTPNDDGFNDLWLIGGIDHFKFANIKIYNRWGNLVYYNDGTPYMEEPWDGKCHSTELPTGIYYYVIDLNIKNTVTNTSSIDINSIYHGTITLVR